MLAIHNNQTYNKIPSKNTSTWTPEKSSLLVLQSECQQPLTSFISSTSPGEIHILSIWMSSIFNNHCHSPSSCFLFSNHEMMESKSHVLYTQSKRQNKHSIINYIRNTCVAARQNKRSIINYIMNTCVAARQNKHSIINYIVNACVAARTKTEESFHRISLPWLFWRN